jgi:hypothetical protein
VASPLGPSMLNPCGMPRKRPRPPRVGHGGFGGGTIGTASPAGASGAAARGRRKAQAHQKAHQKAAGRGRAICHGLPVYRTCCPPANGVGHCETDADRAVLRQHRCWRARAFQGIRINALGLAPPTERGNRSNVSDHRFRQEDTPSSRRNPAPSSSRYRRSDRARQEKLTSTPCCCRSCGRDSSCRCGP